MLPGKVRVQDAEPRPAGAESMRFTDAHTAASVCTPTRYGVLTGRYPMRIGQYGVLKTFSPPIIDEERSPSALFSSSTVTTPPASASGIWE